VIFKKDVSGPRGDRIMRLLEELHGESEKQETPDSPNSGQKTADSYADS